MAKISQDLSRSYMHNGILVVKDAKHFTITSNSDVEPTIEKIEKYKYYTNFGSRNLAFWKW